MHSKTKILDQDEGYYLARNIKLAIGNKEIVTPKRALSSSQNKYHNESMLINNEIKGLVELYRHKNKERLNLMMHNNGDISRFSYGITSSLRHVNTNEEIVLGVLEYDSKGEKPKLNETELLFDLLNSPFVDFVSPPLITKLPLDGYIKFLKEFVEIHKSSSFHPILVPTIPHYSRIDIPPLFEYYSKEDAFFKNFICVDFNGSNPISQYTFVSMIVRESRLFEQEFNDPIILHALNLKYGKATKKYSVISAKDLLAYVMGFSSFGANHKIPRISSAIGKYELRTKLLNTTDYGYYSLNMGRNSFVENNNQQISLNDVIRNEKMSKLFNAERHGLEANQISDAIKLNECKEYIESKKYIHGQTKILKRINKVHNEALQQKL